MTRDGHSATYEVRNGIIRFRSHFGPLNARLLNQPAEALAEKLLALQIGGAARKSGSTDKAEAARLLQSEWDSKWNARTPARWINRPPPAELAEAVAAGWLPRSGRVVDLGCGTAEIAAWFASRGYQATGIDIAQAAVDRAAAKHGDLSKSMEFIAVDLCSHALPGRQFDILVDRGCLHQIPPNLVPDYVRNVRSIAAPGAKLMLFSKAFRDGNRFGDPEEVREQTDWVRETFAGHFDLDRAVPVYLNPGKRQDPQPGMAFWLSRA